MKTSIGFKREFGRLQKVLAQQGLPQSDYLDGVRDAFNWIMKSKVGRKRVPSPLRNLYKYTKVVSKPGQTATSTPAPSSVSLVPSAKGVAPVTPPNWKDTVASVVEAFAKNNESFTSVDVANSVKELGTWVSNRDVADWLRSNAIITADKANSSAQFCMSTIQVTTTKGDNANATLYHPLNSPVSQYYRRNQKALAPEDVNLG